MAWAPCHSTSRCVIGASRYWRLLAVTGGCWPIQLLGALRRHCEPNILVITPWYDLTPWSYPPDTPSRPPYPTPLDDLNPNTAPAQVGHGGDTIWVNSVTANNMFFVLDPQVALPLIRCIRCIIRYTRTTCSSCRTCKNRRYSLSSDTNSAPLCRTHVYTPPYAPFRGAPQARRRCRASRHVTVCNVTVCNVTLPRRKRRASRECRCNTSWASVLDLRRATQRFCPVHRRYVTVVAVSDVNSGT